MSQIHSYLRILTGYGKPKSIGLSFLKSHPPVICWRSSNTTPRRYEKGATHEPYPKSHQIYIYIYILTHATAGWAYDRQSREVWERERKPKANSSYFYSHRRLQLWRDVFFKWRAGFIQREVYNRIDHSFDRRRDYVLHRFLRRYNDPRCRRFAEKGLFIFDGESLFLSTSLTSKEVAA